jgi:hypothetical protein
MTDEYETVELWNAKDENPDPYDNTRCEFGKNVKNGSYYIVMEDGPFSGYPGIVPSKKSLSELYRAIEKELGSEATEHKKICGLESNGIPSLKDDHTHVCGVVSREKLLGNAHQHECWVCDVKWIERFENASLRWDIHGFALVNKKYPFLAEDGRHYLCGEVFLTDEGEINLHACPACQPPGIKKV